MTILFYVLYYTNIHKIHFHQILNSFNFSLPFDFYENLDFILKNNKMQVTFGFEQFINISFCMNDHSINACRCFLTHKQIFTHTHTHTIKHEQKKNHW